MKIKTSLKVRPQGFTLIEMIGVLAIIAILASMLLPKVFAAINNSKINNAAYSYNTAKAACVEHFAKFGGLQDSAGNPLDLTGADAADFDSEVLVPGGFLDKPFRVKVGDNTDTRILVAAGVATGTAVDATNAAFDLDGAGVATNEAADASYVIVAKISGVPMLDALELSERLDGDHNATIGEISLTEADTSTADLKGRVKYGTPGTGSTTTDVYIYIAHR